METVGKGIFFSYYPFLRWLGFLWNPTTMDRQFMHNVLCQLMMRRKTTRSPSYTLQIGKSVSLEMNIPHYLLLGKYRAQPPSARGDRRLSMVPRRALSLDPMMITYTGKESLWKTFSR